MVIVGQYGLTLLYSDNTEKVNSKVQSLSMNIV